MAKDLIQIKSIEELKTQRLMAKHALELERLEFQNSKLKLERELDAKKIWGDLSQLLLSGLQHKVINGIFNRLKNRK